MAKTRIRDLVIILPGITGSVLQKDGHDIWGMSGQALAHALLSLGGSIQALKLSKDDPNIDDLGDGVRATRLMPDIHLIPGLVKIDGYSSITRLITERFDVIPGNIESDKPSNFFEFPYDWRRDNRVGAHNLKKLIDVSLPRWQQFSGAKDAKVILLAHSMGGLISRYYLECLEGWRNCRALITFGTPYRGSVNAIGFLANGYKKAFIDLTGVLRSCTSVYQLLPIYRMLHVDNDWKRIAEVDEIPGVNTDSSKAALEFHREIENAVNKRKTAGGDYPIIPIVGVSQPTFQSATLSGGKIEISEKLPDWIDSHLEDGDGTVPHLSAIPIELSDTFFETFVAGRHGSLQCLDQVLNDLYQRINQMQVKDLGSIKAPKPAAAPKPSPALSVNLEDLYVGGELVKIQARLLNTSGAPGGVIARIKPVDPAGPIVNYDFRESADGSWELEIEKAKPGLFRVEVRTKKAGSGAPIPVSDLFEVLS